jgi:two-component system chemotaxis response regulator CheY
MPQMDGYEFTPRVRATAGYETTPIIIVSTESEAQDKTRGFEAGANVYVVKPTRPNNLLGNARMLLSTLAVQES